MSCFKVGTSKIHKVSLLNVGRYIWVPIPLKMHNFSFEERYYLSCVIFFGHCCLSGHDYCSLFFCILSKQNKLIITDAVLIVEA